MTMQNIAEGIRFCSVKTDKFKTCRVNISLAMPLDKNASSRAILPFMFSRRCAKYPDYTSLNRVLDELYGAAVSAGVLKRGEAQVISFSMSAIDDRFALDGDKVALECTKLLANMIFDPLTEGESFPEDIIEQEKRLLVEAIENEQNDKRRYAMLRCEQLMFADEAYGVNRFGSVEDVKALTPDVVYAAWRDVLEKATVQITMVSSMDPQPIVDLIREKFSEIERHPVEIKTLFVSGLPKPEYISESMPLKQGKLVMGFRTGMRSEDDMMPAMKVAVDIFGGGTYSKLFSVVREKMSLCYYCSAALFNSKGIVMVQSGIEDTNEEKAKNEIINQLRLTAEGEFTDEDFSSSIKSLTDSILGNSDTPEEITAWYASQILRNELKAPETYAKEIGSVDRAEVVRAAKTIMLDTIFMLKSSGEAE
ncbi:peptidase M16 inactive domain protein [Ruminococcus sp. CAG:563]|nr:peptidase M16 inactive domain protein [Ruminococcus sp. CAG:563]